MLIDTRTYSDTEYGIIGVAIMVKCQVYGDAMWLWALQDSGTTPPMYAYLTASVSEDGDQVLYDTIHRLATAEVLTDDEADHIRRCLRHERALVEEYWAAQGRPVPTISEAFDLFNKESDRA